MSNLATPEPGQTHATPRAFFEDHCRQKGGLILIEVIDTAGDIHATAIFDDFDTAERWTEQFENDPSIESCMFKPQYLNNPEWSERKGRLH